MPLHRQIFIALIVGILLAAGLNYVEPATKALTLEISRVIGNLFLNALKAVALPLVVVTLIAGIGNLNQRLGRLGALAISFYGLSTLLAVLVGLFVANTIAPGLHATAPAEASQPPAGAVACGREPWYWPRTSRPVRRARC